MGQATWEGRSVRGYSTSYGPSHCPALALRVVYLILSLVYPNQEE